MAISPGTRMGPYEILSPIGAGGMSVVSIIDVGSVLVNEGLAG